MKPLVALRSIPLSPFIPWAQADERDLAVLKENIKKPTDNIPGAALIKETEAPPAESRVSIINEDNSTQIHVDIHDDNAEAGLLSQQERDIKENIEKNIERRDLPEVGESFPEGSEHEPEEVKPKRETLKTELESSLISKPPFSVYKLFRAKRAGLDGRTSKIEVGEFKGQFRVIDKANPNNNNNNNQEVLDLKKLFKPTDYVVRVYILEGYQLVPNDADGSNNPYIRISNGATKIKDVENKKANTSRPQIFKCYELNCTFPVQTVLDVAVWDWDKLSSDDLIGSTRIDLENRFFSSEWQKFEFKPIEFRTLWNPSSTNPQGQVKLWVDILTPDQAKNNPPEPIAPPTPLEYELRVIIWDTKEVIFKDAKMSDIFVTCYPEGQKPQITDTHWRSEDGTGSFNWRMKFPLILPTNIPKFKMQIWDKDLLNPNDAICEANLNLRSFYKKAHNNKSDREILAQQWLIMTHPAAQGPQGKILVSFELLSAEEARRRPAGFGRSEPNQNPHLPEPVRPESSFNPLNPFKSFKFFGGVFWKKIRYKLLAACICCLILLILIIFIYFYIF